MKLAEKIRLKIRIETRFLLQQKWGVFKPSDPFSISKSIIKKFVAKNAIVIDCGAHVGNDSIELARIFSSGTVHSFEPVPSVFQRLKMNVKKQRNIACYELALSDRNGSAKMFISSGASDASSSLLAPANHLTDHPDVYFNNNLEVKTETLDTWAKKNMVAKVDLLWLDMQGLEFQMLKASTQILRTVKVIHTEVSLKESYINTVKYSDFKGWLEEQGFYVVAKAIPEGTDMGNVLFARR